MKALKIASRVGFMTLLFLGFGLISNAQSPTVTVFNNTACAIQATVPGSYTAGSCNWQATAQGGVAAFSSATLNFIDDATGLPTSAHVIGGIGQNATTYTQAPVNGACATVVTGNCGGAPINVTFPTVTSVLIQ